MRRRALMAVVAAGLLPVAAPAQTLSRAEAVALAVANNPEVRKSQQALLSLRGQGREALADALPEVNVYGIGTRYRDPSLLNSSSFDAFPPELRTALRPIPQNLFDGTAQLKQTLFSFKLGRAVRAARYGISMGEEQAKSVTRAVALDTIRAYNDYLLDLEKVKVADKSVRQRETHVEMARNRRAAGVATELEVLRLQVALENQRAVFERTRGEADLARGVLNAAMVRPIDAPVEPSDRLLRQDFDVPLETIVQEALANRTEVKAAEVAVRVYDEFVGVVRAENRPHLDLLANWGYSVRRPENFFSSDYTKWNAGITLTVPVFDGFRNAGKVAQARARREQAAQDRIALENQIRLAAKQARDALATAGRVLAAADLNVTQAQKALDMTQANYTLGAATPLDVLDAQAALTLAESLRLEALYEHANARATLRWVMGRDPLDPPPPVASTPTTTKAGSE
ncbi:MAG TPA: TolC family protein [Vicinamibacteria bacterium]|nr:TolC family protein [Vicinamibacteria bacterium]